jgi:hypothetical protein
VIVSFSPRFFGNSGIVLKYESINYAKHRSILSVRDKHLDFIEEYHEYILNVSFLPSRPLTVIRASNKAKSFFNFTLKIQEEDTWKRLSILRNYVRYNCSV